MAEPKLRPLHDQVVVITGATSGIGLATARLAARRRARLVLAARGAEALHRLVAELEAQGAAALPVVADVGRAPAVERIGEAALKRFGGVDTWVNNAAGSVYGFALDVSIDDMRRVIETNLWGVIHGSRTACALLRRRGGALINVGSVVGDRAAPLQAIYSASKHAIEGWTDALRDELRHEGAPISVTLIKPSAIDTPYAERAECYLSDQPTHVPPVYTPRAVARAILYAAEHPVRDLYVGAAGRILSLLHGLAPALLDRFMAHAFIEATHSHRPRQGHPALHGPNDELRERGDYAGVSRPSLYTAAVRHRRLTLLFGASAAIALVAGLTSAAPRRAHSSRSAGKLR